MGENLALNMESKKAGMYQFTTVLFPEWKKE